ncbi:uncharacterized protein LOC127707921 [Mytilus californianus]|uniref:uncharacterized protein LOC127707921 n=1 Tax=Mytilus californianus TaxID=6549 RepID=UPI0022476253|nr:uncharacterized protein LOC127707921 [Mytilus californianus]
MAFQLMYVTVLTTLLMVCLDVCHSKTSVTYSFSTDSCNAPTYVVDEHTTTFMTFDGDLRNHDCRQMSFSIPKSIFYYYRMFVKQHYFDSPKCQTMVQFKIYRDIEPEYEYYYDYDGEIKGEGCKGDSNSYLLDGLYNFDSVSFQVKKSHISNNEISIHGDIIPEEIAIAPDKLNDTFKFQIDAELEYNYDVIGGISGGIAGFLILCGLTIYLCICCRRRKRKTGRYCCTCVYNRTGNINAGGLLTECSVGGLLLCSCILCRHQQHYKRMQSSYSDSCEKMSTEPDDNKTDMVTRWESLNGQKDQNTVPLIQCDN